jgi:hypothetical protein
MKKRAVKTNRVEEIEGIQDSIRKLGEQFKKDFPEPLPLSSTIEMDLKTAIDSLDLLKGVYKAKAEK